MLVSVVYNVVKMALILILILILKLLLLVQDGTMKFFKAAERDNPRNSVQILPKST